MSDPIKHAQDEAKAVEVEAADEVEAPRFGYLDFDGKQYGIQRKPSALLISELANVDADNPESIGIYAEFFDVVLGESYKAFRRHLFRSEAGESDEILSELLAQVLEKTSGRPTE